MRRLISLVPAIVLAIAACGQASTPTAMPAASASPSMIPSGTPPTTVSPTPSPAAAWYDAIPTCSRGAFHMRCGTLEVPVDHTAPDGKKITVAYYVFAHTDLTMPALEPVVSVPGGPGDSAMNAAGLLAGDWLTARHDTIVIDPRGAGESSPIDCPDLQDGYDSIPAMRLAAAACATQLGDAADRYGSGDIALDIEAIRDSLGIPTVSLFGFSYGSAIVQAYASRFPERTHAMVIDSGLRPDDPEDRWAWDLGKPAAWIASVDIICAEDPTCAAAHPDPRGVLDRLFAKVRAKPFHGTVNGQAITAGEVEVAMVLGSVGDGGAGSVLAFLAASEDALAGQPDALVGLVSGQSPWPGDAGSPSTFSVGANFATACNDEAQVWDRTDPVETRKAKLAAAMKALPTDAFAPMSVEGWLSGWWVTNCIEWPAPDHFEPVIPTEKPVISAPTLLLVGNRDMQVSPIQGEGLAKYIPGSILAIVDGAGHGTTGPDGSPCAGTLAASFLETLTADPKACAPQT